MIGSVQAYNFMGAPDLSFGRSGESAATRATHDALAAKGAALAAANPAISAARDQAPSDAWRRGFDIGTAVSAGHSASGPGQDRILDTLGTVAQKSGFLAARVQQYAMTKAGAVPAGAAGLTRGILQGDAPSTTTDYATIGAVVVGLGVIGAIVYKMRR